MLIHPALSSKSNLFRCLAIATTAAVLTLSGCSKEAPSDVVAEKPLPQPKHLAITGYRGYLPEDHPVRVGMRHFAELVKEKSNGQLILEPGLPKDPNPFNQLKAFLEQAPEAPQLMVQSVSGLTSLVPEFELFDIPFSARNPSQIDALMDGAFGTTLLEKMKGTGAVGLAYWENGFHHITNSKMPLKTADDLIGLKMRVIPAPMFEKNWQAAGTTILPMPFSQGFEALKSGEAEAQENYLPQILVGKLYEIQKYLTLTNHAYGALTIVANESAWNSLSNEDQAVLKEAAVEAGIAQRQLNRDKTPEILSQLEAFGMEINTMPAEEVEKIRAKMATVTPELTAHFNPEIVALYNSEVARIREEFPN